MLKDNVLLNILVKKTNVFYNSCNKFKRAAFIWNINNFVILHALLFSSIECIRAKTSIYFFKRKIFWTVVYIAWFSL